jgi:hypothetical protein
MSASEPGMHTDQRCAMGPHAYRFREDGLQIQANAALQRCPFEQAKYALVLMK